MAFFTELFSRPRPTAIASMLFPAAPQLGWSDPDISIVTVRPADFPRLPRGRSGRAR